MKKVSCLISIFVSSIFLISGCGAGCDAGEGKKIGQVVKIGEHGMFCPTYEAEIIRGGFNGGSGVNGTALDFSIKNRKLYEELITAMENQEEIELSFKKKKFSGPCYSETGTIATGFRILNPKKEAVKKESIEETKSTESEQKVEWQSKNEKKKPVIIQFEDD